MDVLSYSAGGHPQVDVFSYSAGGHPVTVQVDVPGWMSSVTVVQLDVVSYSAGGHPQVDVLNYTYSALVHLGWRGVGMLVNISTCEK